MPVARVDAHQHFWQPARGDYGWLRADVPALAPLYRDFLPADLADTLRQHGVAQTVLVQAAASEAETEFILSLAQRHAFVGAVVGWVDLSRPDAAEVLSRWHERHPALRGVRPMLQDLADPEWIDHAPHPDALRALQRLGLRFDALVQPRHLDALLRFVRAWPEVPVVIDHAAKPCLAAGWTGEWAPAWRARMAELAACPRVMCKLSGLLTEAPPGAGAATLRPVWEHLLQCFGPARLMWGSDWPVLTLAGRYADWVAISEALVAELSPDEQAALWHGNATRFYGLTWTCN